MPVHSTLAGAISALALIGQASAFWRMECHSPIGYARLDPLVEPGRIADHAHAIHGAQNFNMNSDFAGLMSSTCTSCRVKQDLSSYWTPSLHFQHADGKMELVPQRGGMLAYYLLIGDDIKAFPAGFRMLAGDTRQRNFTLPVPDPPKPWSGEDVTQSALAQKALGFNCLNYKGTAEATLGRHFMPDKAFLDANCADGLRLELMFPSCWNGNDLDSPNHKSHMAYPDRVIDGSCPEGFDTRVSSILFETIWATDTFAGKDGQFVLANGDPTGYGYHGDMMTGWDVDFLQDAINTCTNPSGRIDDCPLFDIQSEAEAALCTMDLPTELLDEDVKGPRDGLPGDVPIQYGPAYASPLHGDEPNPPAYIPPPVALPPIISALVPTQIVGPGTVPVTDAFGGGVTVLAVGANIDLANKAVATPEPAPAPAPAPAPEQVAEQAAEPEPEAEAPAPTPAAVFAESEEENDGEGRIVATSTYTSAGAVYEVVYQQVDITVTEYAPAATPAKKVRRHQHHARHNRRNLI